MTDEAGPTRLAGRKRVAGTTPPHSSSVPSKWRLPTAPLRVAGAVLAPLDPTRRIARRDAPAVRTTGGWLQWDTAAVATAYQKTRLTAADR